MWITKAALICLIPAWIYCGWGNCFALWTWIASFHCEFPPQRLFTQRMPWYQWSRAHEVKKKTTKSRSWWNHSAIFRSAAKYRDHVTWVGSRFVKLNTGNGNGLYGILDGMEKSGIVIFVVKHYQAILLFYYFSSPHCQKNYMSIFPRTK